MTLEVALRQRWAATALDIAFTAPVPGVTVLFGPSGSGKTSTVLAVAGLFRPEACRVSVSGERLADTEQGVWLPPERRRLGVVFQDGRLFPHLGVLGNLRYGLSRAGRPHAIGLDSVVALLGLEPLLERRLHGLSGGERQRIAIGRALLAQPRLLLMDEPLASLDLARRAEILPYLARLRDESGLPILYVTHAIDELARLADTVVLLEAGRVVATGPLAEIAARADLPLALRDDAGAILTAHVAAHDAARGLTRLEAAALPIFVPLLARPIGTAIRLQIPAREVALARAVPEAVSFQNVLPARVRRVVADPAQNSALVELDAAGTAILARVTPDAASRLALAPGSATVALFKSVGVQIF